MKPIEATNFCRVFELPQNFPTDFCFNGGHDVTFKLVDWFNPIPAEDIWNEDLKSWDEYKILLIDFIKNKQYMRPGYTYVLITDFEESLIFKKGYHD